MGEYMAMWVLLGGVAGVVTFLVRVSKKKIEIPPGPGNGIVVTPFIIIGMITGGLLALGLGALVI